MASSNGHHRRVSRASLARAMTSSGSFNLPDLVANAVLTRRLLSQQFLDPRRDIETECGYPKLGENYTPQQYNLLYEREAVAARVVEVLPRESWQVQPTVYELEDSDTPTAFEQAWDNLGRQLTGDVDDAGNRLDWCADEEGSPVWEVLSRADELSGIGRFGVILLGLDDVQVRTPTDSPYPTVQGPTGNFVADQYGAGLGVAGMRNPAPWQPGPQATRKLLYLRVFPEHLVQILRFEANPASPRYGQPTAYSITLNDPQDFTGGAGLSMATVEVHWTRVIHVADNIRASETFALERMRPVLNNLLGLRKLYGGSPEMYWKGALPGMVVSTHPQLGADIDLDKQEVKDEGEELLNGLTRVMGVVGAGVTMLAPTVVDPTPQIMAQIQAICVKLGIPMRVFMGSERGELASSQDDAAWNDRLRYRQSYYITPRIIRPFVNRLIALGVLPVPDSVTVPNTDGGTTTVEKGGFHVSWPDLTSQTDQEKATVFNTRMTAFSTAISGGVESIMTPTDLLTREAGYTEEEAAAILANASEAVGPTQPTPSLTPEPTPEPAPTDQPDAQVTEPVTPTLPATNKKTKKVIKHVREQDGSYTSTITEEDV